MIGILGGMGPEASLDLQRKILAETKANKDQEHLPVIHFSCPGQIADRTTFLANGDEPNPAVSLAEMLNQMDALGVRVAGMPCHTAHAEPIFEELVRRIADSGLSLQLLNLVEVTTQSLIDQFQPGARIGILSTNGTYRTGMYPKALESAGFKPIILPWDQQDELVQKAIFDTRRGLKSGTYHQDDWAQQRLVQAVTELKTAGAVAVILACTELPLVLSNSMALNLAIIDPTRLLARALIATVAPEKLRPL